MGRQSECKIRLIRREVRCVEWEKRCRSIKIQWDSKNKVGLQQTPAEKSRSYRRSHKINETDRKSIMKMREWKFLTTTDKKVSTREWSELLRSVTLHSQPMHAKALRINLSVYLTHKNLVVTTCTTRFNIKNSKFFPQSVFCSPILVMNDYYFHM